MKNLFYILIVVACFALNACIPKPSATVIEEPPVMADPVIMEDQGIIAIEEIIYYTIRKDAGVDVFVPHNVLGNSTISMNGDITTMEIVEDGTGRIINTEQRVHPQTNEDVFVEIGGETESRER